MLRLYCRFFVERIAVKPEMNLFLLADGQTFHTSYICHLATFIIHVLHDDPIEHCPVVRAIVPVNDN